MMGLDRGQPAVFGIGIGDLQWVGMDTDSESAESGDV